MDNLEYTTKETFSESYRVYGFDKKGKKLYVTENGYNPYEWRYEGYYSNGGVHFKELSWAQSEADHAPKNLKNITIEKINVRKIVKAKVEIEIVEYKPKGLEPIICF